MFRTVPEMPPPPSQMPHPPKPTGPMARFLAFVEWLGNLLAHPVTLFALFALGIVIISAIAAEFGLQADARPQGTSQQIEKTPPKHGGVDGFQTRSCRLATSPRSNG